LGLFSKKLRLAGLLVLAGALLAAVLSAAAPRAAPASGSGGASGVRLPVVMYHHISVRARSLGKYVLSPAQFESDLRWLKDSGYESVTADELLAWCRGEGPLPAKPVLITFDDGYESTFVYALPLLRRYGFTAVVSVIGSVSQQYTDRPDHNLNYSHMTWDQVAEADAGGVLDMECHTWDMHRLSPRRGCGRKKGESAAAYRTALAGDIGAFQRAFTAHTGRAAHVLALPFGFYSDETLSAAAELGFNVALTCTEKVNVLTGDAAELMELGRFNRPYGPSSAAFFGKWEQ